MDSLFSRPFFLIYRALWRTARPFLKKNKRLADGWAERLGVPSAQSGPAEVWIQAASGGESRIAMAICQALPASAEGAVTIATWTRQGMDVVEKERESVQAKHPGLRILARFAPLDQPDIVLEALRKTHPSVVLLLETELWPGLLAACRELNISVHVVNGRITRSTVGFARLFPSLMKALSPNSIHATSEKDRQAFASLFPCGASLMPNIKFAQAFEALSQPLRPRPALLPANTPLFLFSSVRRSDETRLPGLVPLLLEKHPEAAIVIAPRHLHRVTAWQNVLDDIGIPPLLWSAFSPGEELAPGRVLLWDHFGDLAQLYASAQAIYVGGAFGEGGQNFLEALSAGSIPCIGPKASNFAWTLLAEGPGKATLKDSGLLFIARNPKEIARSMLAQLEAPAEREEVRKAFRQWLEPRLNGARLAAELICRSLEP